MDATLSILISMMLYVIIIYMHKHTKWIADDKPIKITRLIFIILAIVLFIPYVNIALILICMIFYITGYLFDVLYMDLRIYKWLIKRV